MKRLTREDVLIELLGRAGVRYRRGRRELVVDSEILTGPKFSMCVFRSSIERWEAPHGSDPITDTDRDRTIDDIRRFVLSRGYADIEVA